MSCMYIMHRLHSTLRVRRQGIERCWKNFAVFTCQVTSTREVHEIARFEANCTLLWATFIAVGLTSLAKKHRRRLNMHYVHYVHYVHYDAMRCMWQISAVWDKTFSLLTSSHHPPLAQVPLVPLVLVLCVRVPLVQLVLLFSWLRAPWIHLHRQERPRQVEVSPQENMFSTPKSDNSIQ